VTTDIDIQTPVQDASIYEGEYHESRFSRTYFSPLLLSANVRHVLEGCRALSGAYEERSCGAYPLPITGTESGKAT
jgi:hypothetical protein